DGWSQLTSPLAIKVGPAHGIGSLSVRVIVIVGRAPAGGLAVMRFDHFATGIDSDQRAVRTDLNLHADMPPRRHRIQGAIHAHMVIRMNLAIGPARRIEAFRFERNQDRFFFGLKDVDRYPARRTMDTTASDLPAPDQSSALNVAQVDECFSLKEALAHKTDR